MRARGARELLPRRPPPPAQRRAPLVWCRGTAGRGGDVLGEHIEPGPRPTAAAPGAAATLPGLPRPPAVPPVVVVVARAQMDHDGAARGALVGVEVATLARLAPMPASASVSAGVAATAAPVPVCHESAGAREKGKDTGG